MDETCPYLPPHSGEEEPITSSDVSNRRVYGPERPASLKSSDKERSKKHKSKENPRHKKKEKKSKHRH
ncbi:hypothetical protein K1719_036624 [Acacia pycnantha]|nr:hypothetical protein K1719_036624 [Acacia pycnantha]